MRWAALVPATVLSMALAACGGNSGGSGGSPTGAAPPPTNENHINAADPASLQDGGTFRWAITQVPPNFNIYELDGGLADNASIINAMLPTAFYFDSTGTPYVNKDLLDDVQLTSTNPQQVVTYKINPKAVWDNGSPVNADDFIELAKALSGKNPAYKITSSTGYEDIGSIKQGTNDHEVVVTFAKKYGDWKGLFGNLIPASTSKDPKIFNDGWTAKPLASAGPFVLDKIDKTAKTVTLKRNPKWWGTPPRLDRIVYQAIDSDAQMQSLASGEVDYADVGPSAQKYATAKTIKNVRIDKAGAPNWRHMDFEGNSPILADVNVRKAVAMGIDRARIAAAELSPLGVQAVPLNNHMLMENQKGYQDNSASVKYDPEQAKKLLDQAGWTLPSGGTYRQKNGKELDLNFVIPSAVSNSENEAKQSQAMLKDIGVKINIKTVPSDDFFDKYVTPGQFDITVFSWIGTPLLSSAKSIYHSTKGDDIKQNFSRIGNPTIDGLFDQLSQELDTDKQLPIANQIDQEIFKEAHSLPLIQRPEIAATNSKVANFGAFGFGSVVYEKIGFKK